MKKTVLIAISLVSLIYATPSSTELEHAVKTASSVESPTEDMSKMKAQGKCGADQKSMKMGTHRAESNKTNQASTELEHAVKTSASEESPKEDMSKMKAQGKCGADQKSMKMGKEKTNSNEASVELEHAVKTPASEESPTEDMSKMKAQGKCGAGKCGGGK